MGECSDNREGSADVRGCDGGMGHRLWDIGAAGGHGGALFTHGGGGSPSGADQP